jgi:hypothetical protein
MTSFTFNVSELTTSLTPSNQWEWHAPCKPEVLGLKTKGWDASLSIGPISQIILLHQIQRPDEWHDKWLKELSAAEADGTHDATEMSVWPPENASPQRIYWPATATIRTLSGIRHTSLRQIGFDLPYQSWRDALRDGWPTYRVPDL